MSKILSEQKVQGILSEIFHGVMHKTRLRALGICIYGILWSDRLGISAVGRALSRHNGIAPKYNIKRIDRLVGNELLDPDVCFEYYVPWVLGPRKEIVISLDWTEYGTVSHSRIAINLVTRHGRATPLIWKTVRDRTLKNRRGRYEREILTRLRSILSEGTGVTVLADRGFADTDFMQFIREKLGWNFIIRLRSNTSISAADVPKKKLRDVTAWNGRIIEIREAALTAAGVITATVVTVKKAGMIEPWHLATSMSGQKERVVTLYGRRFTCEEQFRDEKDDRFGIGFKETRVTTPQRRDRFLLAFAIAFWLLTILGAAGERIGLDRKLRANTVRKRTHSLFRQGKEYVTMFLCAHAQTLDSAFNDLLKKKNSITTPYWIA